MSRRERSIEIERERESDRAGACCHIAGDGKSNKLGLIALIVRVTRMGATNTRVHTKLS